MAFKIYSNEQPNSEQPIPKKKGFPIYSGDTVPADTSSTKQYIDPSTYSASTIKGIVQGADGYLRDYGINGENFNPVPYKEIVVPKFVGNKQRIVKNIQVSALRPDGSMMSPDEFETKAQRVTNNYMKNALLQFSAGENRNMYEGSKTAENIPAPAKIDTENRTKAGVFAQHVYNELEDPALTMYNAAINIGHHPLMEKAGALQNLRNSETNPEYQQELQRISEYGSGTYLAANQAGQKNLDSNLEALRQDDEQNHYYTSRLGDTVGFIAPMITPVGGIPAMLARGGENVALKATGQAALKSAVKGAAQTAEKGLLKKAARASTTNLSEIAAKGGTNLFNKVAPKAFTITKNAATQTPSNYVGRVIEGVAENVPGFPSGMAPFNAIKSSKNVAEEMTPSDSNVNAIKKGAKQSAVNALHDAQFGATMPIFGALPKVHEIGTVGSKPVRLIKHLGIKAPIEMAGVTGLNATTDAAYDYFFPKKPKKQNEQPIQDF